MIIIFTSAIMAQAIIWNLALVAVQIFGEDIPVLRALPHPAVGLSGKAGTQLKRGGEIFGVGSLDPRGSR
ncbi:MAG: hypothetical protein WA884_20170 [Methyloceanibacter sp.]